MLVGSPPVDPPRSSVTERRGPDRAIGGTVRSVAVPSHPHNDHPRFTMVVREGTWQAGVLVTGVRSQGIFAQHPSPSPTPASRYRPRPRALVIRVGPAVSRISSHARILSLVTHLVQSGCRVGAILVVPSSIISRCGIPVSSSAWSCSPRRPLREGRHGRDEPRGTGRRRTFIRQAPTPTTSGRLYTPDKRRRPSPPLLVTVLHNGTFSAAGVDFITEPSRGAKRASWGPYERAS